MGRTVGSSEVMCQQDLSGCWVETEFQGTVARMDTRGTVMRFIQRKDDGGLEYKGRTDSIFSGIIFRTNKAENIFWIV